MNAASLYSAASLTLPVSTAKASAVYAPAVSPAATSPATVTSVLTGKITDPILSPLTWTGGGKNEALSTRSDGINRLIAVTPLKSANANEAALKTAGASAETIKATVSPTVEWTKGDFTRRDLASNIGPQISARLKTPGIGISGPRSRDATVAATASGVSDLAMTLGAGVGLSKAQQKTLGENIERVVSDVCSKSKPGDDLIGNIRTAISFTLWGAGVSPEQNAAVTQDLSRLLTKYFPGDSEESLTKMGQFFYSHEAYEIIFADKTSGLGALLGGIK